LIGSKYGDDVDVTFSDEVAWGDFPVFLEMQGELGTQLLYTDSGQTWGEAFRAVAPKYPDTWYACPGSDAGVIALLPPNVAGYDRKQEQAYFIAGAIAAMMTTSNKIGYIGGVDYPEHIRISTGMELGAKWVNPDIETSVAWVGSWTDVEKGYETAKAMIATGTDVIGVFADNAGLGCIKALQEGNVLHIGDVRDKYALAPEITLTSCLINHDLLCERSYLDWKAGVIQHVATTFTLVQGWPAIAPVTNCPDEVVAIADALTVAIAIEDIKVPAIRDPSKLGTIWPADYDIPSAEELGIELP